MRFRIRVAAALAASAALSVPLSARAADVVAFVDIAAQRMTVSVDGAPAYGPWPVSTARAGHKTPPGSYTVKRMDAKHHSIWFHHAWMPYSVFFDDRRAIHGVPRSEEPALGTPASHGCVRLSIENAKIFFELIEENGKDRTTIVIR